MGPFAQVLILYWEFGCHAHARVGMRFAEKSYNMPTASVGMAPIIFRRTIRSSRSNVWCDALCYSPDACRDWPFSILLPVLPCLCTPPKDWNCMRIYQYIKLTTP